MKATFDSLDEYLGELQRCAANGPVSPVRATLKTESVKSGGATQFTVVSGFHDQQYVYEVTLDCGIDHVGGGKGAAKAAAETAMDRIRVACQAVKDVEYLPGQWVSE